MTAPPDEPTIEVTTEQDRAALFYLCERVGIGRTYYDIWGNRCDVPEHGLRSLLRAMGYEAGNRAQVEASIRAEESRIATPGSPLPPVAVFWQDAPPFVVALQSAMREATRHHWDLYEENGTHHHGEVNDFRIELPLNLPAGYHRLDLRVVLPDAQSATVAGGPSADEGRHLASALVIVAPRRCFLADALQAGHRAWGPTVQLYSLRSERNWGIGDFTDLTALVRLCRRYGAALVGLNPLHALFPHDPEHASPYSPSSRRFCDVLYLDVEAVEDYANCAQAREHVLNPDFQNRLWELRSRDLVDYAGVSALKLPILEMLHAQFRRDHPHESNSARAHAFRAFQMAGGPALRRHALFEALQEHFTAQDPRNWGWPQWPWEYRDPESPEVHRFEEGNGTRVEFYEYLQWQAELQLAQAHAAAAAPPSGSDGHAQDAGPLGIGLYQDLAVSVDAGGAESWSAQELFAHDASAGCPPDDFNLHGQQWGLLPMLPERLRARAYAPFIAVLRANMRHSGALRIDHVMGLMRLFWVPRGDLPSAGAYVTYPFEHLLGIVALESQRNRCMVIGEDLGTVPDEVRGAMARSGLLSYRVLYFTRRHDGEFLDPRDFPRDSLVTAATHDLATLAGFWEGRDLEMRESLHLFPTESMRIRQFEERKRDCVRLLHALQRESLLPPGVEPGSVVAMSQPLAAAVQEYLARTPAYVLSVQLEDVFSCRDQVNLPGTVDQYANWRRKLPVPIEQWEKDGRFPDLARRLAAERRL